MPEEILSDSERKELAGQLSGALAKSLTKSKVQEISTPAPDITLFGVEQAIMDLTAFRQDAIERLEQLNLLPPDMKAEAAEEIGEVQAELEAAEMELQNYVRAEVRKVNNIAAFLRVCDTMMAHCKDERDRQNRRAKQWEARKAGVEQIVMEALALADRTSFETATNRLRVQRNGQPKVEVTSPGMVQDRFIRVLVQFPLDVWKQIKTALPELAGKPHEVKDQTFDLKAIGKVEATAAKQIEAAKATMDDVMLQKFMKQVERVKGVQLTYGKHLRVE